MGACRGTLEVGEGVIWESFRASEAAGAIVKSPELVLGHQT